MTPALILDYGGVLSYTQQASDVAAMAGVVGCSEEAFSEAYWRYRKELDLGLDVRQYWKRVFSDIGREGDVEELLRLDLASWSRPREAMWQMAQEFRTRGRTAMLTNNWAVFMQHLRSIRSLDATFDVVVASCDVDLVKPAPAIYRFCLERLQVPAADALFVDDSSENVAAADALGLQTVLFSSDADLPRLRAALRFG